MTTSRSIPGAEAEIENILRFERDFPGAVIVRLEATTAPPAPSLPPPRASSPAMRAAGQDPALGPRRCLGRARARRLALGQPEKYMVGSRIEEARRNGQNLGGIAILVPPASRPAPSRGELITLAIPYRVFGGAKFTASARKSATPSPISAPCPQLPADDLAFERIVNTPSRGLKGDTAMAALHKLARDQQIPLRFAARRLCQSDAIRPRPRAALRELLEDLTR